MIEISEMIHDPDFEQPIVIQRTRNGKFVGSDYVGDTKIIMFYGIIIQPDGSKDIEQTPEGDRASGGTFLYLDADSEVFTTRSRYNGNNISDIYIENYGTEYEIKYRINKVFDRQMWGYFKAQAERMGAI